ncbi:MAG: DUF3426 domain-containing protein [Gammaproteobacteria bacterium]|nr:DUF3426 domain-containing protein [Gammaproteobacteria bacterium]
MLTRCPKCDTCFRVTPEQLKAARGDVRCGRCFNTFNALEHLENQDSEGAAPPTLVPAPVTSTPDTPSAPMVLRTQEIVAEIEARTKVTPPKIEAHSSHFGLWMGTALLLVVTLALQYGFFHRNQLAQSPQLRPLAEQLCTVLFCDLPPRSDPSKLKLSNRDIRLHPQQSQALLVEATLSNQADFTQSFPIMELTFHDISGQVIAGRRFQPFEYLADSAANIVHGMPPRQPYQIKLELADPGTQAVGFEFNFL